MKEFELCSQLQLLLLYPTLIPPNTSILRNANHLPALRKTNSIMEDFFKSYSE